MLPSMRQNSVVSMLLGNLMESTERLILNLLVHQPGPDEVIRVLINKELSQPLVLNYMDDPGSPELHASSFNSTGSYDYRRDDDGGTVRKVVSEINANNARKPDALPLALGAPRNPYLKKATRFTVKRVDLTKQQRQLSVADLLDGEAAVKDKEKLMAAQKKHDAYIKRIAKIDKEIEFLSKLLPPYNVEIDYATRNKITKAIEKLRMKQDELQRKKYDMGITISRLWRGHDESDVWQKGFSNH